MPGPTAVPVTLADVRERISTDESLTRGRRLALRCSLKRVGDLLGMNLADLPADLVTLRKRLASIHHVQADIKRKRLCTFRADLTFALKQCGIPVVRTARMPLSPLWRPYFGRLPTMRLRIGLSRFLRFCDERGVMPEHVNDATSEAFRIALDRNSLFSNHRHMHRYACRVWNEAVDLVADWPQRRLTVPQSLNATRGKYWETLPPSFREEVDRYLAWLGGKDTSRGQPPPYLVSPSTQRRIREQIRAQVSALLDWGYSPGRLTSLSDLVAVETVKDALRHRLDKRGGTATLHETDIASATFRIARDWVRVDDQHLEQLHHVRRRLSRDRHGLGSKTLIALRQFNSEYNLRLILSLPDLLMRDAELKDREGRRSAVTAQIAVAIELFLAAPVYLCDLVRLRVDRHIRYLDGPGGTAYLIVPANESHSGRELTHALSRHTTELLIRFFLRFMPPATRGTTPWLFPGRTGDHKTGRALRRQIKSTILAHTGLHLTPHQFRHLAAKLILEAEPGAYEMVRQLLGKTRLANTIEMYRVMETDRALRHYDRLLTRLRTARNDEAPSLTNGQQP